MTEARYEELRAGLTYAVVGIRMGVNSTFNKDNHELALGHGKRRAHAKLDPVSPALDPVVGGTRSKSVCGARSNKV